MSVETLTLGCRLNFAESEAIQRAAPPGADWLLVNSCAVTNEAVRQTRQAIRRAHRANPARPIVVTGCAAQLDPASFAAMPEVDLVVGNGAKLHPKPFVPSEVEGRSRTRVSTSLDTNGKVFVPHFSNAFTVAAGFRSRVRSFVAVQTGCDHRCTFCTIWQARGQSRSLPFAAIRDAVAAELDAGAAEVVLTGVDITSYACPERSRSEGGLGLLVERLLRDLPQLTRLRLSSLDSIEIDDTLFALIAGEPRLLPHFHLSLQAGDDMILKRMKRRHSRADAVRMVARIKAARPDATIGADLIAGFPTETEEMADNTLRLLHDCDIVAAHVFPFSARGGTPAARMPQVDHATIKARAARLRDRAAERRAGWLSSLVGSTQPVLIENNAKGHSDCFAPVTIPGTVRGERGTARIDGVADGHLVGAWA